MQTDKTAESMREIQRELQRIVGDEPPSAAELERVKDRQTRSLPGRWESSRAIVRALAEIVRDELADDYWNDYPGRVRELSLDDVNAAAAELVKPDEFVWLVIGDRERIEEGIRELGLGELHAVDADGRPVEEQAALARN